MDDITDTLAAYAQVCELSSGVRDIMRAARADIIDLRQRFAVVEEKYFSVLKHWNEDHAELAAAQEELDAYKMDGNSAAMEVAELRGRLQGARDELAAERDKRGAYEARAVELEGDLLTTQKERDALRAELDARDELLRGARPFIEWILTLAFPQVLNWERDKIKVLLARIDAALEKEGGR